MQDVLGSMGLGYSLEGGSPSWRRGEGCLSRTEESLEEYLAILPLLLAGPVPHPVVQLGGMLPFNLGDPQP